nr:hypothetical protein Iba_chr08bCG12580 [Ipomoea batatas]
MRRCSLETRSAIWSSEILEVSGCRERDLRLDIAARRGTGRRGSHERVGSYVCGRDKDRGVLEVGKTSAWEKKPLALV